MTVDQALDALFAEGFLVTLSQRRSDDRRSLVDELRISGPITGARPPQEAVAVLQEHQPEAVEILKAREHRKENAATIGLLFHENEFVRSAAQARIIDAYRARRS